MSHPRLYCIKNKGYFDFPYNPVWLEVARSMPGHRKFNKESKVWEFKMSKAAIEHIMLHVPKITVDTEIQSFLDQQESRLTAVRTAANEAEGMTAEDVRDYQFKTRPFDHQTVAFMRSRDLPAYALFMEQGTGKTKVVIDNAAYLFAKGEIDTLIVACPNSVKTNWVIDELATHMPDWVQYDAAYWESTPNKAEKAQFEQLYDLNGRLKVLVVNIEALSKKRAADVVLKYARSRKSMFVVDESSRIKSDGASRTKHCRHIAAHCNYRRLMTGTPITQSPMDLYAQMRVLDESILGHSSFYSFRNQYAVMGGYEMKEVVAYKNLDELKETLQAFSYRVLKVDCLSLPAKIYQKRYIEHTPEQARVYKRMKVKMESDLADGEITTAKIALVKLGRLQQINSNFVRNDDGGFSVVDAKSNPRLDALVEIIEDSGGKVIVWARFRQDIELITQRLNKEFGDGSAAAFYGGVKTADRQEIKSDFQDKSAKLQFFVGNPEAGGIGLTLTEASTVVYYSNDFSLETRLQSEDRAHRIGQTKNVTYIDIITKDTVDEKIVKALRSKRDVSSLVTGDNLGEWI